MPVVSYLPGTPLHPDLRDSHGWCPTCWRSYGRAGWLNTISETTTHRTLRCALFNHEITLQKHYDY